MSSPGPTYTMLARQVRMGDVLYDAAGEPHAVSLVTYVLPLDEDGNPQGVEIKLDDGSHQLYSPNTGLDVTRPFARHAEAGPHDEP